MKTNLESWSNRLLYLLIATDLLFIALHIIYKTTELISDTSFSLSKDRGYPEVFQYVKAYWIALLFLRLAIKKQTFLYLAWSLLYQPSIRSAIARPISREAVAAGEGALQTCSVLCPSTIRKSSTN